MAKEEVIDLKTVLDTLQDLADSVQYYCIGVYGIRDSFVNESLARARKVCSEARNQLLEEKPMTVKLVIPMRVTLVKVQENVANTPTSPQNPWIRSFPRCFHEKENIIESWQALEIVPMIVKSHNNQIVTVCYQANQDITQQLVLAADSIFSVLEEGKAEVVDYDYFSERYQEHIWLIVYCRKCLTIFQVCGL